jgi:predicted transposase YdaD
LFLIRDHDILKEFLEKHATGVLNMLTTEWNWDTALEVRYEEGFESGLEKGRDEEREKNRMETARKALVEGATVEFIHKITGLDVETIKSIQTYV